jgi:hypothetical protein
MTLEEVWEELIQRLGSGGDTTLTWEQVREWPKGAIDVFQEAGWIKPAVAALAVECPGCEQNCFMPVHVLSARNGQPARAYLACDKRDDMGLVKIAMSQLQQWQITEGQMARWVSLTLGLSGKPEHDKTSGAFKLGNLQGKKRLGSLEFHAAESVSLRSSGHSLPLSEIIYFEGGHPCIDRAAILRLVDLPPASESSDRYQPSRARREARKLDTQAQYESWQKAYREWKRKRPGMTDVWYSQQIAKMGIANSRDAESIRKHMKQKVGRNFFAQRARG